MRFLSCVLFILISALSAFANLTNLVRETFSGYKLLNSSATGSFEVVSGSINARAVGPRLASDTTAASLGWSGRFDNGADATGYFYITNNWIQAGSNGAFSFWIRVDAISGAVGGANPPVMTVWNKTGNRVIQLQAALTNGGVYQMKYQSQMAPNSGIIDTNLYGQWYQYIFEWKKAAGNNLHDMRIYGRDNFSSIMVFKVGWTNADPNGLMGSAGVLNEIGTGGRASMRIGMPSLYQIASIGDSATYDSAIIAPPTNSVTWYVNPSIGNDTNSGVLPAEAWQSAGKITEESTTAGICSSSNNATGDTLAIDTSSAMLNLSHTNLTIGTSGLTVKATNAPYWTNMAWVTLTNSDFFATGSVYAITIPTEWAFGQSNIVVWEDDKWMAHPQGANFGAVSNSLASTNGSFWTDGSKIYIRPFGGTSPLVDGKIYTRSVARDTAGSQNAITLSASNLVFMDCYAVKNCMARSTDNDPLGAYMVGSGAAFIGTNFIGHCYLSYGAKHLLGLVTDAVNSLCTISNVTVEQGSPYASQTPFASFMGASTSAGNTHSYISCTNRLFQGLIGSAAGNPSAGYGDSLYSHNTAGSNQFVLISVEHCYFGGGIASASSIVFYVITNSVFDGPGIGFYAVSNFVLNSRMLGARMPFAGNSNLCLTMRNSIIPFTNFTDGSLLSVRQIAGTNDWQNCTFDISPSQTGGLPAASVFQRQSAVNLLARNNIFRMSQSAGQIFFGLLTNSDTLTLSNNIYLVGTNLFVCQYRNTNCTLATWQAFGFDANSVGVDPRLDAQYNLLGDSRARGFGIDVGPSFDFTGALFGNRRSAGAMEYRIKRSFSP